MSIDTACSSGLVATAQVGLHASRLYLCCSSIYRGQYTYEQRGLHDIPFAKRCLKPSCAQAHNALLLGAASTAIAAAANLLLSPHTHAMFSVAGDPPLILCWDALSILRVISCGA